MSDNDNEKLKQIVLWGADVTGPLHGAVLGLMVGGPAGSIVGAVATPIITGALRAAIEFLDKDLSRREKIRIGTGFTFAYIKIKQYLEEGRKPRTDSFFDSDISGRSQSDELLEGVLLKCKNEHQEKKTRFTGNIYANVAFMPQISISTATYLLQCAERMTYRQLCIIALVQRAVDINKKTSWGHIFSQQPIESSFIAEIRELSGLVHGVGNTVEAPFLEDLGLTCYEAMSLQDIPISDLLETAKLGQL